METYAIIMAGACGLVKRLGGPDAAVLGMKDVVVVQTPSATLVCAKNRVQDLKKLVRSLPAR